MPGRLPKPWDLLSAYYRAYADAARGAGTSDDGVFGVRIVRGTLERVKEGPGRAPGEPGPPILGEALGPPAFAHPRREGVAGRAVSWRRALRGPGTTSRATSPAGSRARA